jgi:hypothetical protein
VGKIRYFLAIAIFVFSTPGAASGPDNQRCDQKRVEPEVRNSFTQKSGNDSFVGQVQSPKANSNPNCLQWKEGACTVCSLEPMTSVTVNNKMKTPLLTCAEMKPGPAKLEMETHAEPVIPGIWEVEFGLGYRTSARNQCPHQFIASNNPTRDRSYEIGPIRIEAEIPSDGQIQALVCVGLSSARLGGEGKETGASMKIAKLVVTSK